MFNRSKTYFILFLLSLLFPASVATSFAQVPKIGHVFIVLEENANYSDVIGNPAMPYLNSLANQYGLATNYFADTHPSIGNYFMLTTGQVLTNDDGQTPSSFPVSADNLVREILAGGKTWKSYAESLPSVGYLGGDSGQYAVRHNPFPYFTDVQSSPQQQQNLVPFEDPKVGFAHDLANNTFPNFSFIAPNLCDDAHDCPLSTADTWLRNNIDPLVTSPLFRNDGILVIVFDESGSDNTNGGGQIAWVVVSPKAKTGFKSTTLYQHQSTLRMLCEAVGCAALPGAAAQAPDMAEFFGTTTSPLPPVAVLTVTPQTGTAPLQVMANSSASSDPNGGIVSRTMGFGDGTTSTAVTATHTYSSAGTFTIQLTVTDNLTLMASASQTVVVNAAAPPANQPPSCTLSVSPTNNQMPLQVTANATCTDPQNSIVSTVISWGDGSSTNGSSASHSYSQAGSFTVKVTATDSANLTGSASQTVTVTSPPPTAPPPSPGTSGPITISGQNGTVMENLHVTNPNGDCVTVANSTNITIRRSEIGPCGGNGVRVSGGNTIGIYDNYIHPEKPLTTACCDTHDGVFANGTSNLSIQGNVIAYGESNIEVNNATSVTVTGNFLLNPINSDPSQSAVGQSRGQNFQAWSNSSNVTVQNNYTLSSTDATKYLFSENQEDSINFGLTNGIIASNNYITGGHSPSGCGLIADTGANSAQFLNNTLLDTGQCGIGIADGTNQLVDGNKILNRNPVNGGGNTALYVWRVNASDPPCGPVTVSNTIATEMRADGTQSGFWNGGGCDPVTLTNNTFDAAATQLLEPSGQKLPPPPIPPGPKDCVAASPFTNNASSPVCSGNPPPPLPPPNRADFGLSATPASQSVTQGGSASYTLSISPSGGFTGSVNLSASGLPSGATATFSPSAATTTSTMTVTSTAATSTGSFSVTITGTSGTLTHTASVTLVVNAALTADFRLSPSSASQSVVQGASTSYTVNITSSRGFTGSVNFSASGMPTGATVGFSPNPATGSSTTMTVSTTATTSTGSFTVTITGTSGTLTHTASVTLVVNAALTADFRLSPSSASQSVVQGASTSYTVNITSSRGFTGSVNFSASGMPTGATVGFSPNPATGSSTMMTVSTTATTSTGSFPVTITGTSGSLTHTGSATLVVTTATQPVTAPTPAQGDFGLAATPPSQPGTAKTTVKYMVTVTSPGGYTGTIGLHVQGLPRGATASFDPPSIPNAGSSTLTVSLGESVRTRTYQLTIIGHSQHLRRKTSVVLTTAGHQSDSVGTGRKLDND